MTNAKWRRATGVSEAADKPVFDLDERTAKFGEAVIVFARLVRLDPVSEPIVKQLVRAATSVGANYCEADDAGTKKEFRYRISLCRRESRESKHWLRMIATAAPDLKTEARKLWQEAKELHLIFSKIYASSKKKGDT
ncbi:MAG: four helix bundle protein [Phycisphaeraceae bacterium]